MSKYCFICQQFVESTYFTGTLLQMCTECSNNTFDDITECNTEPDVEIYQVIGTNNDDNTTDTNLKDISIDEILAQDDPPKELYLMQSNIEENKSSSSEIDDDIIMEILYSDNDDEFFDYYDYFGIPSDTDSATAEGLLEAAMGSS